MQHENSDLKVANDAGCIRILHVDDDSSLLEITKLMLLDLNSEFIIDQACCVDDAFKKLSIRHYDVVVSDYEMPQKTGLQFLKGLREAKNEIPFILFTGKGREEVAIKALNLGVDGYFNKQGNPETVYGELSHGITKAVELKKAIEGLVSSEDKFRAYVENSPVALFVVDSVGKYVDVNDAACNLLSYSRKELLQLGIVDLLFEKDISWGLKQLSLLNETGKARFEVTLKKKDGQSAFVILNAAKLPDGKLMAYCENITELKRNGELLRKSQAELTAIVYNAPLGIATSDSNMRFRNANEAFCRIVGYSEDELQKRSFKDITYPEDVEVSNEKMKELSCGNIQYFSQEKRYVRKDGNIIDGKVTVSAIRENDGKPVLFVAELEDITQQKQAEAELRGTFEILERAGEGIDAGLAVIGKDYRVVWANKQLMALGVAPNKKCYETFNNLGMVCPDCGVEKIFKQNLPLDVHEYRTVNSKGETIWIELRVTPLKDKNGNVTAALELAVPITERKKAEEKLVESKKKYQLVFDNNSDGILVGKRNGTILSANPAICQLLGMTEQEVMNAGRQGIVVDEPRNDAALNEQDKYGQVVARLTFRRKDGSIFEAEISSKKFVDIDGSNSLLVTVRDISNRLMLEEKLRTIGSFTRHDINNKLMSAQGQLFLSRKLVEDQPEIQKRHKKIEAALNSIDSILQVSKQYETIGSQKLQVIDVGKAVDEAISLFGNLKGIDFVNKVIGYNVLADQMLSAAFYNLIDNSVKYGEKATRIEVFVQRNSDGSESVVYQDDGVGISSEDKLRIFEKGFGKGSGYGLFLIKNTCEIYGWTITEEGEQGKGAKFTITIPRLSNYKKEDCQKLKGVFESGQ